MTPILAFFHDPWVANVAFLCIGVFYFGALIRSRLDKGEGAH